MIVLLAACSGAPGAAVDSTGSPVTTEAPAVATTDSGTDHPTTTLAPVNTTTTDSGRPVAPDFTLELNEGGAYTLSEGEKPVYLVFWAEW